MTTHPCSQAGNLKNTRLEKTGHAHTASKTAVKTSYLVSYNNAKAKEKHHIIAEQLVYPCAKNIICRMIGTDAVEKLNSLSLSDNAVQRRISDMSDDIKSQVVHEIKKSSMFALQLD